MVDELFIDSFTAKTTEETSILGASYLPLLTIEQGAYNPLHALVQYFYLLSSFFLGIAE
jgi:hypothetical protein